MKKISILLLLALSLALFIRLGAVVPTSPDTKNNTKNSIKNNTDYEQLVSNLEKKLATFNPGIKLSKPRATTIPNYVRMQVNGGPFIYASTDGLHFFVGDLFFVDETGLTKDEDLHIKDAWLDFTKSTLFEQHILFAPETPKLYINVFTDHTCGFCRKLHNDIDELNAMGIAVRYFAFPRKGTDSDTAKIMQSAWCAPNQQAAMTILKDGGQIATNQCSDSVKKQYSIGVSLGINGTPATFLDDGTLVSGYRKPSYFKKLLKL